MLECHRCDDGNNSFTGFKHSMEFSRSKPVFTFVDFVFVLLSVFGEPQYIALFLFVSVLFYRVA